MSRKGPYLKFVLCEKKPSRKTDVWVIRNGIGEDLGAIFWYSQWRRYCFSANPTIRTPVWDLICLTEITNFIKEQTAAREVKK